MYIQRDSKLKVENQVFIGEIISLGRQQQQFILRLGENTDSLPTGKDGDFE